MKIYKLERIQFIPVTVQEAWDFFSSPYNLEKITPGYMKFKITSDVKNVRAHEGMKIEYTLCPVANIPIKWITLISEVVEPFRFKDIQLKGPYSLWEHTHTFKQVAGGTEMTDEVRYALPMGILGKLAHSFMVKKQLEDIFDYRRVVIEKIFKNYKDGNSY